jgi:hypothetical protein
VEVYSSNDTLLFLRFKFVFNLLINIPHIKRPAAQPGTSIELLYQNLTRSVFCFSIVSHQFLIRRLKQRLFKDFRPAGNAFR